MWHLKGSGVFSTANADDEDYEGWLEFLSRLSLIEPGMPPTTGALTARNFALDEGVVGERRSSYSAHVGIRSHETEANWSARHLGYLRGKVFVPSDNGPPAVLDLDDPAGVPETFGFIDSASPFLGTDLRTRLVRLERLDDIAGVLSTPAADLKSAFLELPQFGQRPSTATSRPPVTAVVRDYLAAWHAKLEQRPTFAVFWDDVSDLFSPNVPEDAPNWADILRDRLGLAHLDPGEKAATIDVVVFRYEVSVVPAIRGSRGRTRLLVPPTVLDGKFSEAFCPSPRGSLTGHVVNLDADADMLRREVLHPRPRFVPDHVFRVGTLKRAVDRAKLLDSRALHLLLVRDEAGRPEYAGATDGDILGESASIS
jgi:hypothetical protein